MIPRQGGHPARQKLLMALSRVSRNVTSRLAGLAAGVKDKIRTVKWSLVLIFDIVKSSANSVCLFSVELSGG